jgi:hypothetical protein
MRYVWRTGDALALVAAWLLLGGGGAIVAWREADWIVAILLFAFASVIMAAAFLMHDES